MRGQTEGMVVDGVKKRKVGLGDEDGEGKSGPLARSGMRMRYLKTSATT